jgi:arylsulfatase A-like enzyme/lipid-A-disaccharide synthase-like uncharacterized protein
MKQLWSTTIKSGTVLGVLIGCAAAGKAILLHRYLACHLYNTSAKTLALSLDFWTPVTIVLCGLLTILSLWITYAVSKKKRVGLGTNVLLIIIATLGLRSIARSAVTDVAGMTSSGGSNDLNINDLARILISIGCLLFGSYLTRWIRRRPDLSARFRASVKRSFDAAGTITSRLFVPCLAILLIVNIGAAVLSMRAQASAAKKPNIIFIMMDTTRADHLGCYGYPVNTSPNIDNLARQGVRFTHAVAQAPFTIWSVPSFMTSQYPEDLPHLFGQNLDTESTPTLAEVLSDQGYVTSGVISNPTISDCRVGFDHFKQVPLSGDSMQSGTSPLVLVDAVDQLSKIEDRRFFLFLLFMDPHSPYVLHDQYDFSSRFKNEEKRSVSTFVGANAGSFASEQKRLIQPYYDSEIRYTDEFIGKLFRLLKQRKLYDSSLIIFLADHGEEFGEHGQYFHGQTLYNQALSVPVIIKSPEQRRQKVVKGVFRLIDVFPTVMKSSLCDSSGLNLQGNAIDLERVDQLPDYYAFSSNTELRSVANSRYKCIVDLDKMSLRTFDILNDPAEKRDISALEPAVVNALKKAVLQRDAESQKFGKRIYTQSDAASTMTDQQKRSLRTLGYLAN